MQICLTLILALFSAEAMIYGGDDRVPAENHPRALFRELARSVGGIVPKDWLTNVGEHFRFGRSSIGSDMDLCREESFWNSPTLPSCSAFLLTPELMVTAGHCFNLKENDCKKKVVVFDFKSDTKKISRSQVYHCKEIIQLQEGKFFRNLFASVDYAIFRLDRPVLDREPLELSRDGIREGQPLVMIGHPSGLPLMITDGAYAIRPRNPFHGQRFFYANLDAFEGNSGSPVIDERSGLVEGILFEGDKDYFQDEKRTCWKARQSPFTGRGGEKVLKASEIHF